MILPFRKSDDGERFYVLEDGGEIVVANHVPHGTVILESGIRTHATANAVARRITRQRRDQIVRIDRRFRFVVEGLYKVAGLVLLVGLIHYGLLALGA